MVVIYWNLDSSLSSNQFFLVVELREVRVLEDFFNRDAAIWVEFHHLSDQVEAIVTCMRDEFTPITLLYLPHQFEHFLAR